MAAHLERLRSGDAMMRGGWSLSLWLSDNSERRREIWRWNSALPSEFSSCILISTKSVVGRERDKKSKV